MNQDKEIDKMLLLLRRVYNVIEMNHLNDHKMVGYYVGGIDFPKKLGDDIFNYLQAKDQTFRSITIKRQKRWRNRKRIETKSMENS
jgi:phage terminase large subunit GpA-like protein